MKKVILLLLICFAFACTDDELREDEQTQIELEELQASDPNDQCPPNDRNCNGIPDDQEGGN